MVNQTPMDQGADLKSYVIYGLQGITNIIREDFIMKKFTIFCLSIALLLSLPLTASAKNFDVVPTSIDQIKEGDTYGKGDGEIKVFDKDGNLIIHKKGENYKSIVRQSDGQYDNGNYGGFTDAWWYYNPSIVYGSGPKAEAGTYSYAADGASDYLSASIRLYVNGSQKDQDTYSEYDTDEVTVYVEYLKYAIHGVIFPVRATTSHKVIDSEYGWNATFATEDSF